mgnify:CR=1 FL=1
MGSVEWGEDRAAELSEKAIAYINLDSAVTGADLNMSGSPSLRELARQSAAAVPDPNKDDSVGGLWEQRMAEKWASASTIDLEQADETFELHLGALGSGSDYTVFLDHLGIAAVDFGFRGKNGVYHSAYDNFNWMDRFGDPGFAYHATAARLLGILAMRLASSDVLPFRFGSYAGALEIHLQSIERQVVRINRKASVATDAESSDTLIVDFSPVETAIETFGKAGAELDAAVDQLIARQDSDTAAAVNDPLMLLERSFLSDDGLPARPWFRHLLCAPGLTTGYGAWPFPELAEAIENRDPELFSRGVARVVDVLEQATRELEAATALAAGQDG